MFKQLACVAAALGWSITPAFAHLDPEEHGSLRAGFSHPLSGLDHVLTMAVVGLWAALLGGRSIWLVPATFVVTMMAGFGMGMADVGLPFVEPATIASAVVIGLLTLMALRVPTVVAMVMVGTFALFHGHAHGGELGAAGALPFMAGFGIATVLLHTAGIGACIGLARATSVRAGRRAARIAGGLTALGGLLIAAGS
jgi:urease accessory protein